MSKLEGIPEDQWCYEPNESGQYGSGMKIKEGFWKLTGYRLPTEAEWEFACRAGATTSRYYGETKDLLPNYGWCLANADDYVHPVAHLKPNDFGLFDTYGNVSEWSCDNFGDYPKNMGEPVLDTPASNNVDSLNRMVLRGGAIYNQNKILRSAHRSIFQPNTRNNGFGFRPVRTYD